MSLIPHLLMNQQCLLAVMKPGTVQRHLRKRNALQQRLNLSEDVAGATFMAAGSSAPELFTAILGVFIAKGDVGTGTIVGSAVFNILFVIGICGLLAGRMIVLSCWPLFRDSICYSLSVIILFIIIYDKTVTWYESLIMLIGYVLYILLMKFNRNIYGWMSKRLGLIEEDSTALSILSHGNDKKCYSSYVPFNDEIDDFAQTSVTSQPVIPADEAIRDSQKRVTLYEAALMMLMTRHFRPYIRFRSAAQRIILEIRRQRGRLTKLQSQSSVDPTEFLRRRRSVSMSISWTADAPWRRLPKLEDGALNVCKWFVRIPVLATLHYTIPDCKKNEWRNWFLVAFFMSITWTAVFSYIMVWMVTLIGFTMGIPDTIMGITLLAAGTSVPDAFASLIVVKQGQGDMAVSNSIGSNVFDILVGLALPWFIQTSMVEPGSLATINSQGMVYSVIILFLIIVLTIYAIYRSNWQLTKKLGIFLLATYFVFLVIFSLLEFNIVGNLNPPMCPE
ncbi:sodium/potassium/calcium exchanger 4-like isoform X2 [Tachypleus tridentatus]|uniref:sodium/potassium/calcium exchanger 4-like isoform X2 n=1 Tax=Tachypleus tridentatus TaxID=6853 RepID=UPI003FD69539